MDGRENTEIGGEEGDGEVSRFDLHVHTKEGSPCASVPAADVIRLALEQGLDGIVFTDHHYLWPRDEIERTVEKTDGRLVLLTGQEITFFGIDYLVLGWDGDPSRFKNREEFVNDVRAGGGSVLVAHPYSILYYLDAETMASWGVDGVEVLNTLKGGPTVEEWGELKRYGLAETAGSDFHRPIIQGALGNCWTEIRGEVKNIEDLCDAIREGRTSAVSA